MQDARGAGWLAAMVAAVIVMTIAPGATARLDAQEAAPTYDLVAAQARAEALAPTSGETWQVRRIQTFEIMARVRSADGAEDKQGWASRVEAHTVERLDEPVADGSAWGHTVHVAGWSNVAGGRTDRSLAGTTLVLDEGAWKMTDGSRRLSEEALAWVTNELSDVRVAVSAEDGGGVRAKRLAGFTDVLATTWLPDVPVAVGGEWPAPRTLASSMSSSALSRSTRRCRTRTTTAGSICTASVQSAPVWAASRSVPSC